MERYRVHIVGRICWLPPHKPERNGFPPGQSFLAIARFTSDLDGPTREALINYSPVEESVVGCYMVRLHYRTLENDIEKLKSLARNAEILIMDSYKVIAVCRNISLPETPSAYMDDEWTTK